MPRTLYDLTGKFSGIVLQNGCPPLDCVWTNIRGIPRWFRGHHYVLGEHIPYVKGQFNNDINSLIGNMSFPGKTHPKSGMVYEIDDITIIAPNEWP